MIVMGTERHLGMGSCFHGNFFYSLGSGQNVTVTNSPDPIVIRLWETPDSKKLKIVLNFQDCLVVSNFIPTFANEFET